MDPVWLFLLCIAGIFLIGALGEITFQRTNIPDVIWLILAGILIGPVAGFVTRDHLASIAPYFAALTLVIVLFEGGSALKLRELSRAAPRSTLLAMVSFTGAAAIVTLASMAGRALGILPDTWTWTHGMMLGAILGGSSSIVIMPAMAQARLDAKLANLVNLESALTDAFCVVGTVAILDILRGTEMGHPALTLSKSFGIGIAVGGGTGFIWILFLRALRSNEHAYPVTLSALLILYVVIDHLGGSAALGILTVAVLLGNAPAISRAIGLAEEVGLDHAVRGVHRQMAFMVKSFFFVFVGAALGQPWSLMLFGALLGALLWAVRIPSVRLATLGSDFTAVDRQMIAVAMPRGMAAGVLATLPTAAGVPGTEGLPVVVFATVVATILVFAVGFPWIRTRMPAGAGAGQDVPLPAGAARPSEVPPKGFSHAATAPPAQPNIPPAGRIPDLTVPDRTDGGEG